MVRWNIMTDIKNTSKVPEAIWKPYLYREAVTYIVGDPGVGKTTLAYALIASLANDKPFIGIKPELKPNILIMDFESSHSLVKKKNEELGDVIPSDNVLIWLEQELTISECRKQGFVDKCYKELPFDLLILDNLGSAWDIRDENDNAEAAKHIKELKGIATKYNCAILLYHHPSKANLPGSRKGSGAFAWARYCDISLNMNEVDKLNFILEVETAKNRFSEDVRPRYMQKIGQSEFIACERPDSLEGLTLQRQKYPVDKAMDIIKNTKGSHLRQHLVNLVRSKLQVTDQIVDKALSRLVANGLIKKSETRYGYYDIP